jgi:hypothetical protein
MKRSARVFSNSLPKEMRRESPTKAIIKIGTCSTTANFSTAPSRAMLASLENRHFLLLGPEAF